MPPIQACCSKQVTDLSHSPTLQPCWGLTGSGSITARLFPNDIHSLSGCTQPLGVCHFIFISPLCPKASRFLLVLLKPCLAGKGAVDLAFSQEPCSRPGGCWAWSPRWTQRPYCPEALSLSSDFSMSSTIFDLQPSHMLGYCWLVTLFLRRSERCFTHVQGKWTPLPPISPPSPKTQIVDLQKNYCEIP